MDAVPLCPSLVAVMVAVPVATAVRRPAASTVATAALLDPQVTVRPERTFPAESRVVAAIWTVLPTPRLAAAGDTLTAATGAGGGGVGSGSASTTTIDESESQPFRSLVATTKYSPAESGAV